MSSYLGSLKIRSIGNLINSKTNSKYMKRGSVL